MSQGFIVCVCRFTYNWASIVRVCSIFYYTVDNHSGWSFNLASASEVKHSVKE